VRARDALRRRPAEEQRFPKGVAVISLRNLSVRHRLLLVLALPTLGLLAFAIAMSVEKAGVARTMERLDELAGVSVLLGEVAHELQKERGMSAGFLGAEGRRFAGELPGQRRQADGRLAALREALAGFERSGHDAGLGKALEEIARRLEALPARREAVDALRIEAGEAIEYYTGAIDALLAIPRQASLLGDDSGVARRATAYASLLSAKEHAGIERATLTNAFAAGRFTPESFARYLAQLSAQDLYLRQFLNSAAPAQRALFESRHAGAAVEEVARFRGQALARGDGRRSEADPQQWFRAATSRIDILKEVEDALAADLRAAAQSLRSDARRTAMLSVALPAAALAAVVVLGFLLAAAIARPLERAVKVARAIADGDLASEIRVHGGDELGRLLGALAAMQHKLEEVTGRIRASADQVNAAAREIAGGNSDLSARTEEQAASLEETAASMEEITTTVRQNADNARHANRLADFAREKAAGGGKVASEAVDAMERINAASRKIADIIGVIDEIAFQTNLLALNAAVEAARAGESGRGFAVVAGEVRNLASRSAQAAKEIKALINDSLGKIRTGTTLVAASGEALSEIVESVQKVTAIVAEIATASQEQASGIEQVNRAVMQMDEATQQNAALVEEAAAAAKSMEEQARRLADTVAFFGAGRAAAAAESRHEEGAGRAEPGPGNRRCALHRPGP
jgi:methyl-accepting chemotaxis protein